MKVVPDVEWDAPPPTLNFSVDHLTANTFIKGFLLLNLTFFIWTLTFGSFIAEVLRISYLFLVLDKWSVMFWCLFVIILFLFWSEQLKLDLNWGRRPWVARWYWLLNYSVIIIQWSWPIGQLSRIIQYEFICLLEIPSIPSILGFCFLIFYLHVILQLFKIYFKNK